MTLLYYYWCLVVKIRFLFVVIGKIITSLNKNIFLGNNFLFIITKPSFTSLTLLQTLKIWYSKPCIDSFKSISDFLPNISFSRDEKLVAGKPF